MKRPLPSVSVIVPFLNPGKRFERLLDSLAALDYPREQLEVLLVDNGCTDGSPAIGRQRGFNVLDAHKVRNSYAARNVAVGNAHGEVLAFTDADCSVHPEWVREGVARLEGGGADLAGGKIQFAFSQGRPAAEYYDALTHMQSEILIRTRRSTVTANLFVRAHLFRTLGLFSTDARSGGDAIWTRQASDRGFRLVYAPRSIVYHPARPWGELFQKAWRVGTGYAGTGASIDRSRKELAQQIARALVPGTPGWITRLIRERGEEQMLRKKYRILLVAYLYGLTWAAGALVSVLGMHQEAPGGTDHE